MFVGSPSLEPDAKIIIQMTVKNIGRAKVPPVLASIVVARNTAGTDCAKPLGNVHFPGLGVGQQHTVTATLQLPTELPAPTGFVVGHVNPLKRQPELSYLNNKASDAVASNGRVDLVAKSATPVATLVATGTTVDVTTKVENDSCVDAGQTPLYMYLSADDVLDASDPLVMNRTPEPIAAEQTLERTTPVYIPFLVKPGRYKLIMVADPQAAVTESDETNNVIMAEIDVFAVGTYKGYETGCQGSNTLTPTQSAETLGDRADPYVGSTTRYSFSKGTGSSAAIFTLGFSRASWNTIPLPLDLMPFGAPTCRVVASPEIVLTTPTNRAGNARVDLAWPSDVAFVGGLVYTQFWSYDPAANALGLAVTGGIETRLGSLK